MKAVCEPVHPSASVRVGGHKDPVNVYAISQAKHRGQWADGRCKCFTALVSLPMKIRTHGTRECLPGEGDM